ncbi:hypothetical protein Q9966_004088 [Columba livia]|nr:hypothetical protein Q9966_004088 [Columba livia]
MTPWRQSRSEKSALTEMSKVTNPEATLKSAALLLVKSAKKHNVPRSQSLIPQEDLDRTCSSRGSQVGPVTSGTAAHAVKVSRAGAVKPALRCPGRGEAGNGDGCSVVGFSSITPLPPF